MTQRADESDDRTDPDRRGSGEACDVAAGLAQNHAGTQKSDAGQDALRHATNGVRISQSATRRLERGNSGRRRAQADQAVRTKSRSFAVKLPVQPQQATREQRHDQTNCNLLVRGCH